MERSDPFLPGSVRAQAAAVGRIFVGNYKRALFSRLYLNHRLAHIVAVIEMSFNPASGLIVLDKE